MLTTRDAVRGCLLAGAVGDALGAPIEFDSLDRIRRRHGQAGVRSFLDGAWPAGSVTDDTQMTLFTAEGLLDAAGAADPGAPAMAAVLDAIRSASLRWLRTQSGPFDTTAPASDLLSHPELWVRRAPGNTCLSALQQGGGGTIDDAINNSKGCGGVMRVAPAGFAPGLDPLLLGARCAAQTHGHPSGYWSAGAAAQIVHDVAFRDAPIIDAVSGAVARLDDRPASAQAAETADALRAALALGVAGSPSAEQLESLGGGWVGEEALAISVACAIGYDDPFDALCASVNHSGDSDSTGTICGNLLGTALGPAWLPTDMVAAIDVGPIIVATAEQLAATVGSPANPPHQTRLAPPQSQNLPP